MNMDVKVKKNLGKYLLIAQISIYAFIILHSILWYVFGIHVLTKLCPFTFATQVGSLELNFTILFWTLVFGSTLFLGRAFCAWGCMFGAYQDFVSRVTKTLRIKPIKSKYGRWLLAFIVTLLIVSFILTNQNYWPSLYWFAAMTVFAGMTVWWLVEKDKSVKNLLTLPKYIYVAQYLGGIIALWITLNVFQKGFTFVFEKYGVFADEQWVALFLLAALVALGIVTVEKRVFCKYLCPVGMVLRFTSAIPFPKKYKVRATGEQCIQCGKCNKECMMGLKPMEEIDKYGVVKDPNCINCLACVSTCPKNVLDFKSDQKKDGFISKKSDLSENYK